GMEGLESRTLLATILWNTTSSPAGGDWNVASNWVGGVVPGAGDVAVINLTSAGTVQRVSAATDSVLGLSANANTSFRQMNGTLNLTSTGSAIGGACWPTPGRR